MVITDPVADMLMLIRNAGHAGKKTTLVPFSDLKLRIASVLQKEGYVEFVAKKTKKGAKNSMRVLEIGIAYEAPVFAGAQRAPRVRGMERVSRPSRRMYVGAKDLRPVKQGHGITILSTPKGVLTDVDARKEHVGGEILCKVW
jgi:small subunit ribosomal protein S8